MSALRTLYRQIEAETAEGRYNGPCEVHMSAVSNAADTCRENGNRQNDDDFGFVPSDDFLGYWYSSVQSILCDGDSDNETREWFEARGVKY